jgi:hypothetical protein
LNGVPPPPQESPGRVHGPQSISPPQPSPIGPHSAPAAWQVVRVQPPQTFGVPPPPQV